MPSGIELIAAERQRQIDAEGWTPQHDDEHAGGELRIAAMAYAWLPGPGAPRLPVSWWPWEQSAWKPTGDAVRDLVKAGALIAAEIDRLQRREVPDAA